jgi:hypothetical protein
MTSIVRHFAQKQSGLTMFHKPDSPSYTNGDGDVVLFPFVYSNGVLDISYEGNNFEASMVDTTGVAPDNETDISYSVLSGPKLVTSLGENFKAYIRAWRTATIDSGSPIEVYTQCQVMRVQQANNKNITATSGNSYVIGTIPPSSDNYIAGAPINEYLVTYVFKTPLTFTTIEGGVKQYITFNTYLDQE